MTDAHARWPDVTGLKSPRERIEKRAPIPVRGFGPPFGPLPCGEHIQALRAIGMIVRLRRCQCFAIALSPGIGSSFCSYALRTSLRDQKARRHSDVTLWRSAPFPERHAASAFAEILCDHVAARQRRVDITSVVSLPAIRLELWREMCHLTPSHSALP